MNSKLRSDSVFAQLTNEQLEVLEDWLFEDKLGYKEVMEKAKQEWDVKTSLTALGRFYRRLALQREEERRLETVALCLESLAAKNDGTLQAGLLALANQCAIEFLVEHPKSMREFTGMLRALTSAGMFEMKHVEFQRAEEGRRQREIEQREKEENQRQWREEAEEMKEKQRKQREEKRQAKLAEKKAAEGEVAMTNDRVTKVHAGEQPEGGSICAVRGEAGAPAIAERRTPGAAAESTAVVEPRDSENEAEKPLITA